MRVIEINGQMKNTGKEGDRDKETQKERNSNRGRSREQRRGDQRL